MQHLRDLIEDANRRISTADHLVYMTYPMLRDPKLIMKIAENIEEAMRSAIEAVVYYDRLYKRIQPTGEEFTSKYYAFKSSCAKRYNIQGEHILAFEDLRKLIMDHKESPTSFVKGDAIVICADHFRNVRQVSFDKVKNFLNTAKQFILKANQIVR